MVSENREKNAPWLRHGLTSILDKGASFFFGFAASFILARVLTRHEFGVWVIFYTISGFIEVTRFGLQQNALVRFMSASTSEEEKNTIASASMTLNGIITTILVLLLAFSSSWWSQFYQAAELQPMLYVYCLTTIAFIPQMQYNFIQQAELDFRALLWSNLVNRGGFFILLLLLLALGIKIELLALSWALLICALAGSLTAWWLGKHRVRHQWGMHSEWVGKLYRYGRFVLGTNIGAMLLKSIDKMMLGSMRGPEAAAVYEWAIKITNLTEVPTNSVASVVFPQVSRLSSQEARQDIKQVYERSVGIILAINIPFLIFMLLFAEWTIQLLASAKYLDTAPILRLTMLYGIFLPFAVQFGTIMDATGHARTNFLITILSAILNAGFNYLFITHFGVAGAAYGTLSAYATLMVINQSILYRQYQVSTLGPFLYMWRTWMTLPRLWQQFVKHRTLSGLATAADTENEGN